jgi:phosphatidylethanolamine/phosphatidyl-N-methylethanolamine N-methyltransferase
MKMTNRWNRVIYGRWAPVYDTTLNHFFMPGRRRAMALLSPQFGERILVVGVGTGADLPLLPGGVEALGIDLCPEMLARARGKLAHCRASVSLVQADAQTMPVAEQGFDAAVLNLILSVVPDAAACLQAALRALKPGGRAVIFDKFQPDGERLSRVRQVLNQVSTRLGTDITRRFGDIAQNCLCEVTHDEPGLLGGLYRVILLRKMPLSGTTSPCQAANTSASVSESASRLVGEPPNAARVFSTRLGPHPLHRTSALTALKDR